MDDSANVIGGIIEYVRYLISEPLLIKILKYIKKSNDKLQFIFGSAIM